MAYDVFSLCEVEERGDEERAWYLVEPAKMYPATIARIKEALKAEGMPEELVDNAAPREVDPRAGARMIFSDAQAVKAADWDAALKPGAGKHGRAMALEVARLWFTRALQLAIGGPLGVHIARDEAYRL